MKAEQLQEVAGCKCRSSVRTRTGLGAGAGVVRCGSLGWRHFELMCLLLACSPGVGSGSFKGGRRARALETGPKEKTAFVRCFQYFDSSHPKGRGL